MMAATAPSLSRGFSRPQREQRPAAAGRLLSRLRAHAHDEARRIAERFEWHYTPKHGSWLNIAECELSIMARQCLDRRIPDQPSLEREVSAWATNRNAANTKTNWHFTTDNARTKLAQLYPQIN